MTDQEHAETAAKLRFFIISGTRLTGAVAVMLAIMVLIGTVDWPPLAGYGLLAAGLANSFVIPQVLVRRWSSRVK